jgi:hypothetical protein
MLEKWHANFLADLTRRLEGDAERGAPASPRCVEDSEKGEAAQFWK